MKEKMIEWMFLLFTTLLVPCFITLIISGTEKRQEELFSGILLEYENGQIVDMEEFLPYMIAGEISLDYEEETLKAQAVVARTNLMRELNGKKEAKVTDLSLNYLTPEKFEASLGEKTKYNMMNKLKRAVKDTYSQVLTYQNSYIEALYHPVSIGNTVSAEEIFGKTRPYLVAVTSSQDVESEQYMTIKEIPLLEALHILQGENIAKELTEDTLYSFLQVEEKTENGYVKQIAVGNQKITGDRFKEIFQLNSTNFYLEEKEGSLRMIVLGKGHGIGLSQFGANVMAKEKKGYKEILKKYYPGTKIQKIEDLSKNHV